MDIDALRAFAAVAEQASFSRAADQIHLTQPAVSKRVAALEGELNTRLFDRIGRRVILTEAGNALLPGARRILEELGDLRRRVDNLSQEVRGRLSLATSHHIGLHRLPPVLRAYTARYPEVELDLHFMDSEAACAAIEHGDLELAVVTLPQSPAPALSIAEIWADPLILVAGRGHPLAGIGRPLTAEDLTRHPAILPAVGTFTREIVIKALGDSASNLDVVLETNYMETIKMMVSIGLGWSALPLTMLSDDLVTLSLPGLGIQRRLGSVRHRERTLSNAGNALLEMLREQTHSGEHG